MFCTVGHTGHNVMFYPNEYILQSNEAADTDNHRHIFIYREYSRDSTGIFPAG